MSQVISSIKNETGGFTLVELLLVIAITLVLASAAATPIYGNLQGQAQLQSATADTIQMLRTARERSVSGVHNTNHGVYFDINEGESDFVILYAGDSYDTRDLAQEERVLKLPAMVTLSVTMGNDINFSSGNGLPNDVGTINFNHEIIEGSVISINALGVVGQE